MLPNLSGLGEPAVARVRVSPPPFGAPLHAPAPGRRAGGTGRQPRARRAAATSADGPSAMDESSVVACPAPYGGEYVTVMSTQYVQPTTTDARMLTLSVAFQFEGAPTLGQLIRAMLREDRAETHVGNTATGAPPEPDRTVERHRPTSAADLVERFKNLVMDSARDANRVSQYLSDKNTRFQVIVRNRIDEKDSLTFTMQIPSVDGYALDFFANDFYKLIRDRMVWKKHREYRPFEQDYEGFMGLDGNNAMLEMLCAYIGVQLYTLKESPGDNDFVENKILYDDSGQVAVGSSSVMRVYVRGICTSPPQG